MNIRETVKNSPKFYPSGLLASLILSGLWMFLVVCEVNAQVNDTTDRFLQKIAKTSDEKRQIELTSRFILLIYHSEYNEAKKLGEYLLKKSDTPDLLIPRGFFLIHTYRFFSYDSCMANLNKAQVIGLETGNDLLISTAYTFKAIVFRDNSRFDSAMTYALMAKDIFEKNDQEAELITNLQMIGDMHYYAGEIPEAEKMYSEVLSRQKDIINSHNYRIIMNNLGLIRMKQGRFDEAESYFLKSLEHLKRPGMAYVDSAGIPYMFRKLMEIKILTGRLTDAERYFNEGVDLCYKYGQESELTGYYTGRAEILYRQKKYNDALESIIIAEKQESRFPDIGNKSRIYRLFADIYSGLGRLSDAIIYFRKYNITERTVDSLTNRAKLLHLYAQHNFKSAVKQAENYMIERNLSMAIAMLIMAGLIVNFYYFLRIKKKNRMLMEKNLQLAYVSEPTNFHTAPNSVEEDLTADLVSSVTNPGQERRTNEPGDEVISRILAELEEQMEVNKVYLDPALTIVSLAEKLSTNRTYLSKAIQLRYKMNFLEYINGYRIKESLKIMNSEQGSYLTLEGIASISGFSNRVTFAKIFREATGVTPSYFMKNIQSLSKDLIVDES